MTVLSGALFAGDQCGVVLGVAGRVRSPGGATIPSGARRPPALGVVGLVLV